MAENITPVVRQKMAGQVEKNTGTVLGGMDVLGAWNRQAAAARVLSAEKRKTRPRKRQQRRTGGAQLFDFESGLCIIQRKLKLSCHDVD